MMFILAVSTSLAAGVGGQIYATGGQVNVTVLPPGGGFTSELWLDSPGAPRYLGVTSFDNGSTVPVGSFSAGDELVFAIRVRDTGDYFRLGPASRNPDNLVHGRTADISAGVIDASFEDLFGGGDNDLDDANFRVSGHVASSEGACCIQGHCYMASLDECRSHSGTFRGDGTKCQGRNCAVGACCIDGQCHGPTTRAVCEAHGGSYGGDGSICSETNCDRNRCSPPGVCATFQPCGPPGTNCVCATLAEGGGRCTSGGNCAALPNCNGSGDCPPGYRCYVDSCCGVPKCAPDCLGQPNGERAPAGDGPTFSGN